MVSKANLNNYISTSIACLFEQRREKDSSGDRQNANPVQALASHLAVATRTTAGVDVATVTITHPISAKTIQARSLAELPSLTISRSVSDHRPETPELPLGRQTIPRDASDHHPETLELPLGRQGRGFVVLEGGPVTGKNKVQVRRLVDDVGLLLDVYAAQQESEERLKEMESRLRELESREAARDACYMSENDQGTSLMESNGVHESQHTISEPPRSSKGISSTELAPTAGSSHGDVRGDAQSFDQTDSQCQPVSEALPEVIGPLVWHLQTGIIACNAEGLIIYMNASARERLNVGTDEKLAMPIEWLLDRIPEPLLTGKRAKVEDTLLWRVFQGETITNHEFPAVERGGWKSLLISGRPLFNAGGTKIGAMLAIFDMTEQVYRERERGKSETSQNAEERFHEFAETVPHIIWMGDKDGRTTYVNNMWTEYTGVPISEFLEGGAWAKVIHPADLKLSWGTWSQAVRTGEPFEYFSRIRRKDGCYRWHLARSTPVRDPKTGEVLKWFGSHTDVHEQRESLRLAQELHAQLRQFISHAVMVAWAVDEQGVLTFMDGKGFAAIGTTPGSGIGQSVYEVYKHNRTICDTIRKVLATGETITLELEEGGRWWYETFAPLLDPREKIIGCLSVGLDITSQKTAVSALVESEKRAKKLIESNLIGVIIFDRNGDLLDVNEAYLDIVGMSRSEYEATRSQGSDAGSNQNQCHLRVDQRIIDEAVADKRFKGKFEHFITRKDGSQVPVLVGISALDASKKEFVAFTVDLTEQVKLLRQAQEAEQRLRDVVDNLAGVFMWCIDSSGNFTVCDGKGLTGLISIPPSHLLGMHYTSLFGDTQHIKDCISRAVSTGQNFTATVHHPATDRYFETHFSSIHGAGTVVGICTDISERLLAERALQDTLMERNGILAREAAAKEASKMKSEFLATMRTPIAGVIGLTDILLETQLTPAQREYGTYIRMSAECLLTVINDILDFSKVEAGKMELSPSPFHLVDMVKNVVKLLDLPAQQKSIKLDFKVDLEKVPERVVGDEARIRQILLNFLSNAIKFTSPNGQVSLTLTNPLSTNLPN
ncbi:hypothetical protein HK104_002563, partial [Borealophlyctis nickersoniae]